MCSNLLCLPVDWVDNIYFVILFIANILNCLTALAHIYMLAIRTIPCLGSKKPIQPMEAVPIAVVVPCYLPNEQTIILSTIEHIMQHLDWPGPLTLHVVYNTPAPLPFEATLQEYDGREFPNKRVVRVLRAEGSTSKAENLNLILQRITSAYVVLYGDATSTLLPKCLHSCTHARALTARSLSRRAQTPTTDRIRSRCACCCVGYWIAKPRRCRARLT